jgi:outer membrane protein, heavy metal efflux system
MNRIKLLIPLCLWLLSDNIFAQQTLSTTLDSIAKNNNAINANKQYWEARKLEFKTDLNPYNPLVEYDRLNGSPTAAGIQNDFSVTQSFDFPTSYYQRRQVSDEKIKKSTLEHTAFRQNVLLKGKLYFLELVYLNRQNNTLQRRLDNVNRLYNDFAKKFKVGEANLLDLNKIKIQVVNLKNDLSINETERRQFLERLAELNGGKAISLSDTIYPLIPDVPAYPFIDSLIEANDAELKIIQQEKEISEKEVQLTKSLSLPKIEAGYHYQSILGQKYQGVHLGMSIPLWQDANKVKQRKANLTHAELQVKNHLTEHLHEIKELYLKYENLKGSLEEYKKLIGDINNETLLEKALKLGEISTIEYFMELTFFHSTYDKYLNIEKEYNKAIAELFKFEL